MQKQLMFSERIIEDHECLVELLSVWGQTENTLYFLQRPPKYVMFTQPQVGTKKLNSKFGQRGL